MRDKSIALLRFLAVLFVVNSHMDVCYPDSYKALATGGSLGDALFFFCSGFTLFLGRADGFVSWYKRRLARIMPSVIVCVLAYACCYGLGWFDAVGGHWFIRCILIYYVALFFIRRYLTRFLWIPFILLALTCCIWWFGWEDPKNSVYAGSYFMWCHYFLPMLLGAVVGRSRDKMHFHFMADVAMLCVSVVLYYSLWKFALRHDGYEWLQLVSIPFLSLAMLCLFRVANAPLFKTLMSGRMGAAIAIAGSLCLEVYLSHRIFLTDAWNQFFPLNVIITIALSLVFAYFVRCVSRFMVQTFDGAVGYDWRSIVRLR